METNRENAWKLLCQYNKEPFHLQHALTVEAVMKYFAEKLGYADEAEYWGLVGLLQEMMENEPISVIDRIRQHKQQSRQTPPRPGKDRER